MVVQKALDMSPPEDEGYGSDSSDGSDDGNSSERSNRTEPPQKGFIRT
jgi:hypothetical protein